jgi:hypothetical protein
MFRQGREMHEVQGDNSAASTTKKGKPDVSQITNNAASQKNKFIN